MTELEIANAKARELEKISQRNADALMIALKALKDIAHENRTHRIITSVEIAYAKIKPIIGVE